MIVYSLTNIVNGKMYIGQTIQNWNVRRNDHWRALNNKCHENFHLQNSWNKYGKEAFEFHIIQECQDQLECDWIEIYWIETLRPNIFNLKSGGKDCWKLSDESRKKMSKSQTKRCNSPEGKKRMQEMSNKQWENPQNRIRQSVDSKKMWRFCSEEIRVKMLENLHLTSHQKSKLSKKVWENPEYRAKFEKNYGEVISPDGVIYEIQGLRKFSREHDLDPSTLSVMCSGKIKQYKGWRKL